MSKKQFLHLVIVSNSKILRLSAMKKKLENIYCLPIIFLITLSFTSCYRDNGIPKANLEFLEVKKQYSAKDLIDTFKIKFLSDIAISDDVFKNADTPRRLR